MKKEYLFWREIRKSVREECSIEANSIEEATKLLNDGEAEYLEVDCFFDEIIDEYEHLASCIFDKRKTEWGYCKEYWNISKKDELKENCFWDDWMLNAIEVYSETEITNDQAQQIQEWGLA